MSAPYKPRLWKTLLAAVVGAILGSIIFLFIVKRLWPPAWHAIYDPFAGFDDSDDGSYAGNYPYGICIFLTLPLTLVFGPTLQALLQRMRLTGYLSNVGVFVVFGVMSLALALRHDYTHLANPLIFAIGLPFCIASIFWLIRRPDRYDSTARVQP